MKMMKKIFPFILAFLLVFGALTGILSDFSVSAETSGNCIWSLDGTTLTISGSCFMENFSEDRPSPWGTEIETVVIKDGITGIGAYAFANCNALTSVIIPNSVGRISDSAFLNCSALGSIELPGSISVIEGSAFRGCGVLSDIWYVGTLSDRNSIEIDESEGVISTCIWHYVTSSCDSACNECGQVRAPRHYTIIGEPPHEMQNSSSYPFDLSDGWYVSTNKADNSSSTYTIVATHDCTLEIHYMVCSQKSSDYMRIEKNSSLLRSGSGEVSETVLNVSVVAGDVVEISYIKNYIGSYAVDCIYFKTFCNCTPQQDVSCEMLEPTCTEGVSCSYCGVEFKTASGHIYDHACDNICNVCEETRSIRHDFSTQDYDDRAHRMKCSVCGAVSWSSEEEHSYHNACDAVCNGCRYTRTTPDHVFDDYNDLICNVCGYGRPIPYTLGDLDEQNGITIDDAIYLLFHVNFPEDYPRNQPADFEADGEVNVADAIYLLHYVFFPEYYPLDHEQWLWPLPEETAGTITRYYTNDYSGIDIEVGGWANNGKIPALATARGIVIRAGYFSDWGNLVVIQHTDGYLSYYAHLDSLAVSVGDVVFQGDELGKIGATGQTTTVKLFFVFYAPSGNTGVSVRVDPLNYVKIPG